MGEDENNGPQEQGQEDIEQRADSNSATEIITHSEDEGENSAGGENKAKNKEKWYVRLRKLLKRPEAANWLIAAATVILATVSIYQYVVLSSQLGTTRKDQRPWIVITPDNILPQNYTQNIIGTTHIVNRGKTPARNVVGEFFVATFKNGSKPDCDFPRSHSELGRGTLFPDSPDSIPIFRGRYDSSGTPRFYPFTDAEIGDAKLSNIFILTYGTIWYSDFYGIRHWTKFCGYMMISGEYIPIGAASEEPLASCSSYNDIDQN